MRVDRLDDEAKRGIEASRPLRRAIGAPVLTIHLFVPMTPEEYRDHGALDEEAVGRLPRLLRRRVPRLGRHAADRERAARAADAHRRRVPDAGRRPLARPRRVVRADPGLRTPSTPPTRRCSSTSPPRTRRCSGSPTTATWGSSAGCGSSGLIDVAHVSDAHGLLGEGLPYGTGELDLDPVVRALGETVPYIVAEINEPDPAHSGDMKAGYRAVERALARPRPITGAPAALEPAAGGPVRLAAGGRPPRSRALGAGAAGALRRPARADHGRGRLDRRAPGLAAARLPARARDAARLPRGVADRRPARPQPAPARGLRARARRHPRRRPASPPRSSARGPT